MQRSLAPIPLATSLALAETTRQLPKPLLKARRAYVLSANFKTLPRLNALILAAGKGERLGSLTENDNKVLLDLGGRSVIAHMLQGLAEAGIAAVTIVTGHCAEKIECEIGPQFGDLPIRYLHNCDFATANNSVSLAVGLADWPADTAMLLLEGDLLLDPVLIQQMAVDARADFAMVERMRPGLDGTLARVDNGLIIELIMGEELKRLPDRSTLFKTVNVTRLSARTITEHLRPALEARLQRGGGEDYYEAVFAELIATGTMALGALEVGDAHWAEIDDEQDLDRARFLFAPKGRRATLDRSYGGYWNYPVLDFAYPRNCHFPTPAVEQELAAMLPAIIGRYGSSQTILDEKLARFLGCPPEEVVLLNGLSQVYPWITQHLGHIDAFVPHPTFGEYARIWPHAATYRDMVGVNMSELELGANACSVIIFVNPNNPTGSMIPSGDILDFALSRPDKIIIVDESFTDFSAFPSLIEVCSGALPPNILLIKSLGKALGAAGLRLGFLRCSAPEIVAQLRKWLPVWNCNAVAEAFLEILPKHRQAIAASLDQTRADRSAMVKALAAHPAIAEIWPSEANFLLVRLAIDADALPGMLDQLVSQYGLYLKDVSDRFDGFGAMIRVAVRTDLDNQSLYEALSAVSARPAAISPAIQR